MFDKSISILSYQFDLATHLDRFRLVAILEGVSYLLLLIAVPLKYLADIPEPVMFLGRVHGVLFIVFGVFLLTVWIFDKWPFLKVLTAFIASLIPFGAFWFDQRIDPHRQKTNSR